MTEDPSSEPESGSARCDTDTTSWPGGHTGMEAWDQAIA